MDPSRFVFLDETGASTNMIRRYGRCPRGERLVDATPSGHWKVTTFVAGLRETGIIAPFSGEASTSWPMVAQSASLVRAIHPIIDDLRTAWEVRCNQWLPTAAASSRFLSVPRGTTEGVHNLLQR